MAARKDGKARKSKPAAARKSKVDQPPGPSVDFPWDLWLMREPEFDTTKIYLALLGETRYQTLFAEPLWGVLDHAKSRLEDCIGAYSRTANGRARLKNKKDVQRYSDGISTALDNLIWGLYSDTTLLDLLTNESGNWDQFGRDIKTKAEELERAGVFLWFLRIPDDLSVRFQIRHLFAEEAPGRAFLRHVGTVRVMDYFTKPVRAFASNPDEQRHIKALIVDAGKLGCLKCYPQSQEGTKSSGVVTFFKGYGYCCDVPGAQCAFGPSASWCWPTLPPGCAVGSDPCV